MVLPRRCKAKLKRRQPGPAERGGEQAAGGQRAAGSTMKQMGLAYLSSCHLRGGRGGEGGCAGAIMKLGGKRTFSAVESQRTGAGGAAT